VCGRGLDPVGMEDTGRYYADFYLPRPRPQVALGGAGGQGGLMAEAVASECPGGECRVVGVDDPLPLARRGTELR
jgi:hypothetical protein